MNPSMENLDYTDLGGYTSLMVILNQTTASATGLRQVLVSIDNGATYLAEYLIVSPEGTVPGSAEALDLHSSQHSNSPRSGQIIIQGNIAGPYKAAVSSVTHYQIPTHDVINAIRIRNSGGGLLMGGRIYVLGRR